MSKNEVNEHLHVSCLIDHLKNVKNPEITKTAETIAVASQMNEEESAALPMAIQYTHGVANMAQALAQHDFTTAILFDSPEAFEFSTELMSDGSHGHLMLIEDPIPITDQAFPMSPDGHGWKTVILDDMIKFVGGDADLTSLLRSISSTMREGGNLLMRITPLKDGDSWSREHNDTVVAESIEKMGLRKFKRAFTSHGAISLRHEEMINSFSASDLHDCARNASFRPTRELGLDPSSWCCYEKI